jgi:hypothetical protein
VQNSSQESRLAPQDYSTFVINRNRIIQHGTKFRKGYHMNNTRKKIAIIGSSLLLALAGCGGGGGSISSGSVSSLTGVTVARSIENGFFARQMGGEASTGAARTQLRGRAESNEPFFDEEYELYGKISENRVDYFLDQALTQPAGGYSKSFVTTATGYVLNFALGITAGPYTGLSYTRDLTLDGSLITFSSTGQRPGAGSFAIVGSVTDGRTVIQSTNRDADGVNRFYNVTVEANGSSKVEYNTNQLFSYTLNYAADQSGSGTVTGNSALLPANLSWNSEGTGTLVFANGTTLNFVNFEFNSLP